MAIFRIKRFSKISLKDPDIKLKDNYHHSESHSSISSYNSEEPEDNYEINHSESHGSHEEPEEDLEGFLTTPEGDEIEFEDNKNY